MRRFSFFGIRVCLVIYLSKFLGNEEHTAKSVYHEFIVICYFSPIFGAILSDGYIGLYRTIVSVSFVYFAGEIILTIFSLKPLGAPNLTVFNPFFLFIF